MLVCLRGDPGVPSCEVIGLDILATRHPNLFALIVQRMGFNLEQNNVVVCAGDVNERCQPDQAGRQVKLRPNLYPTDVLNILTETGGFTLTDSSFNGGSCVVWNLHK